MSNKVCGRCQTQFTCGIEAGQDTCWCFDLPHVIPLDSITIDGKTNDDCLCPQCLQDLINRAPQQDNSAPKSN